MSAYEQHDLPLNAALANELKHGVQALRYESQDGAKTFTKGSGRHGSFQIPARL